MASNIRTFLSSLASVRQERNRISYFQVFNHFLAMYGTEYITPAADMDVKNVNQHYGQSALDFVQATWTNALRCEPA